MNKDQFESNWKQIRSESSAWWSLISDLDLIKVDKAEVKLDKYTTILRVKYGYSNEQVKKEISQRMAKYENTGQVASFASAAPAVRKAAPKKTAREKTITEPIVRLKKK